MNYSVHWSCSYLSVKHLVQNLLLQLWDHSSQTWEGGMLPLKNKKFLHLSALFMLWQNRNGIRPTNWGFIRKKKISLMVCHGDEWAELKGEALDLPAHLRSTPHLWTWVVEKKTKRTGSQITGRSQLRRFSQLRCLLDTFIWGFWRFLSLGGDPGWPQPARGTTCLFWPGENLIISQE